MAISKPFKSLNLKKIMRKLCTDEVRGVKMKKKTYCNSKKRIFFTALFWLLLWLCISKVELEKELL
jgi:Na+-transporting methylmalonyl-CoA/oxaloacetate decarboxylase beta subunit